MPEGEGASKGRNSNKTAALYLAKIPGPAVDAVRRAGVDGARVVEHVFLSLRLVVQENSII